LTSPTDECFICAKYKGYKHVKIHWDDQMGALWIENEKMQLKTNCDCNVTETQTFSPTNMARI
jgi:hypothetical protein